jgi:hypothetical protein
VGKGSFVSVFIGVMGSLEGNCYNSYENRHDNDSSGFEIPKSGGDMEIRLGEL